jgi:predicted Zn-dependent peptidase
MAIEFRHATLPNGLTIIAEVSSAAHTAAMGFFVKTGARDEDSRVMGVSHFLEHMMFKGTATRSPSDVDREFDELGCEHNAFTTSELTAFWLHGLPERLEPAGEVLADIMRPALRQDDFGSEKKVILEEIAMYRDHPFWVLYEQAMEAYYGAHPLSHRVLGTPETIAAMTREEMVDYFTARYSADNTVVALAGNLDFDRMVDRLGQWCGAWQTTRAARAYPPVVPGGGERAVVANGNAHAPGEFTMTLPNIGRHYTIMIAPGPAMNDEARYAAAMLARILGDTEGSRLYWALIETGIAEEAQADHNGRDGCGETLVYCSCPPEAAEQVEETARREIAALADSLTEDDLERTRSKIATGATLQGELPGGRMRRLGQLWTYLGEYRSLEDELERINRVTLEELRRVAAAWPLQPIVTGRLTPAARAAAEAR